MTRADKSIIHPFKLDETSRTEYHVLPFGTVVSHTTRGNAPWSKEYWTTRILKPGSKRYREAMHFARAVYGYVKKEV